MHYVSCSCGSQSRRQGGHNQRASWITLQVSAQEQCQAEVMLCGINHEILKIEPLHASPLLFHASPLLFHASPLLSHTSLSLSHTFRSLSLSWLYTYHFSHFGIFVHYFVNYFVRLRTNHYTLTISPISVIFDSARNLP